MRSTSVFAWMLLAGAGLIIIGSFLPWATFRGPFIGTVTGSGMNGSDGVINLFAGLVLGGIGIVRVRRHLSIPLVVSAFLAVVIALAVSVINLSNLQEWTNRLSSNTVAASPSVGLWAITVGAIVGFVGVFRA